MIPEFSVYVSNISTKATTKTVSDFFSFCGKIVNLYLRADSTGSSQQAIVVFESDSAAKTALLLTNALIVDKVITVVQYTKELDFDLSQQYQTTSDSTQQPQPPQQQYVSQSEEDIVNREHPTPDNERSKTSVIASIIAAGYSVGQDAAIKARQVDDEHLISLKLKVGAEAVKEKVNEFDNKLHISESAVAIKGVVVEKANLIDEKFQITGFFKSASDFTSGLIKSAEENSTISPIISKVSSFGNYLKQEVQQIQTETSQAIDEKNKEKGIASVDSSNSTSAEPTELQPQQQYHQSDIDFSQQQQQQQNSPQL